MACSVLLSKPAGQKISKVRKQQKKFQFCQSYSYVNRKVWCQAFWIWKQKKIILPDLLYIELGAKVIFLIIHHDPQRWQWFGWFVLPWDQNGNTLWYFYVLQKVISRVERSWFDCTMNSHANSKCIESQFLVLDNFLFYGVNKINSMHHQK